MNLEKIEKQLYSDKFLDEKNNYIYASLSNKIGGLIGSVKGLVLLSVYEDILYIHRANIDNSYGKQFNKIIYVFLTIFLYLLKCPQSLIL